MSDPVEQLEADLAKRPRWLQDAVCRLTARGALSEADIRELTALCKAEAGVPQADGEAASVFQQMPTGCLRLADNAVSVRLESVGSVKGVNTLAPKKPLEFGDEALCVVFGGNGAGKSGYVRILKQLCGARGANSLHGNVFDATPTKQSCEVSYVVDGSLKSLERALDAGPLADLTSVSIYDTACAAIYVNEENQVTFEPAVLRLLRLLVDACDAVGARLKAEIEARPSALPLVPDEHSGTNAANWWSQLSDATAETAIETNCAWGPEDETALQALAKRATEASPAEKARALRKTKTHAEALAARIRSNREAITDAAFDVLAAAKKAAAEKRTAATEDAKRVFENALEGIATESWRLLWAAARSYSEQEAYKGRPFPYVGEGARCVLCQQLLGADGKSRIEEFEGFVMGSLEASAEAAETALTDAIDMVPSAPVETDLAALLDLAGVNDESLRNEVSAFYRGLEARAQRFGTASSKDSLPALPSGSAAETLQAVAAALGVDAEALDKDAQVDQQASLKKSLAEANGRKWISQQKTAAVAEVSRRVQVRLLEEAQRLTNTSWLSKTKTDLAEVVVSKAFIDRFEAELAALGASHIRVAIERTRTTKGQVFHQVKITGAKRMARTAEVLSDGEFRIVSIAAFVADVEAKSSSSTFIFDDPVSSLDQEFEEATAERLVALAKGRQVIVFTHRLSMLSLVQSAAEKVGMEPSVVMLRKESWGTGEPDKSGRAQDKKPDKAINALLNERLSRARAALNTDGQGAYEIEAKALCSDLRITLERLVELILLNNVVQRFRRDVQTKGKLRRLAIITEADCELIDKFMTKYSFHEHAQPYESPVAVPTPEELESDLKALAAWCDDFKKRPDLIGT